MYSNASCRKASLSRSLRADSHRETCICSAKFAGAIMGQALLAERAGTLTSHSRRG